MLSSTPRVAVDTIAAISTPPGRGGISVVRVSGPDAIAVAQCVFRRPDGRTLSHPISHRSYLGTIVDPNGQQVDEVLLCVMRRPRSYTCEDVVEISGHGGPFITEQVLEAVVAQGARVAEPGEFTKRAFVNGRLDLAQAEAVIDLINARTYASHRAALHQLDGALSRLLRQIREDLLQVSVYLEAGIDFPEEDIELVTSGGLIQRLASVEAQFTQLLGTFRRGRLVHEGLTTAIVGRPNVGKSSLLNALLGRDRAIVSSQPGTTRDTVEAELNIDGLLLKIIDTAGIRVTEDCIEQEGVRRAREVADRAELLLAVVDRSTLLTSDDRMLLAETSDKLRVVVCNKSDLPPQWSLGNLGLSDSDVPLVSVSATAIGSENGLAELEQTIVQLATGQDCFNQDEVMLTQVRHQHSIGAALSNVQTSTDGLRQGIPLEFVAFDVTEAIEHVSNVLGESCSGAVLDLIFSQFCIGK